MREMQHYKNTIFINLIAVFFHIILIFSKQFNGIREQSERITQTLRPYFKALRRLADHHKQKFGTFTPCQATTQFYCNYGR